jgi:hypothetical protein
MYPVKASAAAEDTVLSAGSAPGSRAMAGRDPQRTVTGRSARPVLRTRIRIRTVDVILECLYSVR